MAVTNQQIVLLFDDIEDTLTELQEAQLYLDLAQECNYDKQTIYARVDEALINYIKTDPEIFADNQQFLTQEYPDLVIDHETTRVYLALIVTPIILQAAHDHIDKLLALPPVSTAEEFLVEYDRLYPEDQTTEVQQFEFDTDEIIEQLKSELPPHPFFTQLLQFGTSTETEFASNNNTQRAENHKTCNQENDSNKTNAAKPRI